VHVGLHWNVNVKLSFSLKLTDGLPRSLSISVNAAAAEACATAKAGMLAGVRTRLHRRFLQS
jgi:hypothetical protein